MANRFIPLLALVFILPVGAIAQEVMGGIAIGATAPELKGGKWLTADGKDPELKGKVHFIDFWFAG